MNPTVRPARPADLPNVVDFNARLARETENLTLDRDVLTAGVSAGLADASKARYFVAEIDGRVVGQLMLTLEWSDWRNGEIWWIQSVYVHADHRRHGVFKAIYRHVESLAKQSGAVGLRLYVEKHNAPAQSTYASLGMSLSEYLVMEKLHLRG